MNTIKKSILFLLITILFFATASSQNISHLKKNYSCSHNLSDQASDLNKICFYYLNNNELDSAEVYFIDLVNINKTLSNQNAVLNAYFYLGNICFKQNRYDEAISYYEKSLSISIEQNAKDNSANTLINISLIHQANGKNRKSIKIAEKALVFAEELLNEKYLRTCYNILAENYQKIGNNSKAIKYISLYQTLDGHIIKKKIQKIQHNEKLIASELNIASSQLKMSELKRHVIQDSLSYEQELKKQQQIQIKLLEQENTILEQDKELTELKLKHEKLQKAKIRLIAFVIGGALIITLVLLMIILRLLKLRNKINIQLFELNKTKDKFFSIISHDLKSPIRSIKSLTDLLLKKFNKFNEAKKLNIMHKINDSSALLYDLLENLLNWSRSQRQTIHFNPKKIDVNIVIENTIKLLKSSAFEKKIEVINKVNVKSIAYIDENMISTVFRNLINNAIKFTKRNGKIEISHKIKNKFLIFKIKDNGIGIPKENIKKLFKIDKYITTKGTEGEPGTGLGLVLCKDFIKRNNGTIWIESEVVKGTTFYFSLPKK